MVLGATFPEILFVAMLVALVLLAPVAPRVGQAIGHLLEKGGSDRDGAAGGPEPKP